MALSKKQMNERHALMSFWYLGFCTAGAAKPKSEPSLLAHGMFCPFIHLEHPHLRLNVEEIALAEVFDPERIMPGPLKEEIKVKLRTTANETGLSEDFLLAAAYGYSAGKAGQPAMTGAEVIRKLVVAIHESFEESLAKPFVDLDP